MIDVTGILISIPIMSFLVIIASLIAFMILIIIEKMLILKECIHVDIISDWYQLYMYLK